VARIRDEGLNRSEVMTTLSYLTDITGSRLTGSSGLRHASEWSRDQFKSWGLVNSRLEPWGPFGRGWSLQRFSAQVIAPQTIPLIAFPKAWSPGLGAKPFEGDVVHVDIKKPEDFEKFRGKLRGKIVLDGAASEMKLRFEPLALRRTDTQLMQLANSDGTSGPPRPPGAPTSSLASPEQRAALALTPQRYQFFSEEGVRVLLQPSRIGESGTLFAAGATVYPPRNAKAAPPPREKTAPVATKKAAGPLRGVSPWKIDAPPIIPQLVLATEHFNRLVRMAQHGEKIRALVDLQAKYHTDDLMAANVLAEIPGGDLGSEIVMLGAHLDSWHSATGATDNAAGCAVVMEAVRILQKLELKPRRTIRVALWTGEEQGLLGSKAYVAEHFGAPKSTTTSGTPPARNDADPFAVPSRSIPPAEIEKKPAHGQLTAYFNLDNGAGKIRGVYLQNNEAARPIFRQWLKPFKDLGAETLTLANTGGTDHLSFDAVGLPGFQFIQDELEYNTRTHHGNMDFYDRTVAEDLRQAAVIMAAFVYQAAMRDEKIPRKPAPAAPPVPTSPVAAAASGEAGSR
jgi:carboxypeptidase Q